MQLFAQRDKLGKLSSYAGVCETATSQILNQTQKSVFFCTLPWRGDDLNELIHRCDASMSLIKKYRPYPLDQNHQTTTNANKQF